MSSNRPALSRLLVIGLLALLVVAACSPLPAQPPGATATASATPIQATETPAATASAEPSPTAMATETPVQPADTASPEDTATPLPTETPRAGEQAPTNTPVPTNTPALTNTPVPPTATPLPTSTFTPTPAPITDWRGEYFANRTLQSPPVLVRNDRVVDFNFAAGQSPAPQVPSENWSARWSREWSFDEGNYRFQLLVDDGARLWVNNRLIIDAWNDGAPREFAANLYLRGSVPIRLEYYNHLGGGRARLNWERVTSYPDWLGSYYAGLDMSGLPYFQRNDTSIDFNWGAGAPRADMPADNFAVRWTRRLNLDRAGTYRFQATADDGVRLWVDGRLAIDSWQDGYSTHEVLVDLAAGRHDLRLDYYERLGGALIRLDITFVPGATPTFTATPVPPTATSTSTPLPQPATPTWTTTPAAPTATFTPTPAPPLGAAEIRLEPAGGTINQPVVVIGSGWPGGAPVDLYASRPGTDRRSLIILGQVTADGEGRFRMEVRLPPAPEMQAGGPIEILARARGGAYEARASYQLTAGQPIPEMQDTLPTPLPRPGRMAATPVAISYQPIPATEERFALAGPTFLALDSAAAWALHFGAEPPPADPPVQWEQEYVLGAFLGPQPAGVQAQVQAITHQDNAIVVRLTTAPIQPGAGSEEGQNLPRVLLRVGRAELRSAGVEGMPHFVFVNVQGQTLAQGPAGGEPLSAALAKESPAEPGIMSVPEAGMEEGQAELLLPPAAGGGLPEGTEQAELLLPPSAGGGLPEEAEIGLADARQPSPGSRAVGWLVLGLWLLTVAAVAAGAWLLVRRALRE